MKQDEQHLTPQALICQHMARAALWGDLKALAGHALVYQAIVNRAKANT